MTRSWLVEWSIELEADTPLEAAKQALAFQRDPESIATVFDCTDVKTKDRFVGIDADPLPGEPT